MADPVKTPIPQSLVQRIVQGVKYIVTGKKGPEWFGPMEPLEPIAPPETAGRAFDYATGKNLQYQPRSGEPVTFETMRALADSYDILRLVIETRKDQVAKLQFEIKPIDDKSLPESDKRPEQIKEFFKKPDQQHTWQQWMRIMLEDMLVIDAPAIYPRPNLGGTLYALEPVDGATITCLIDQSGRTPKPPDPAYQQIIKGMVATEYTSPGGEPGKELIYLPRNKRANKVYGYSPVEQIIMTVNIAIRRQLHKLEYYTAGSVPDALMSVPDDWTIDQIQEFQAWWDSILSGQTAERRKARFIPGGSKPYFTKEDVLKDEYDEWLARVICYCFSVSPTPFVKQMNRATAQSAQEAALQEGLFPLMLWIKDLIDGIIHDYFKCPDLEFAWKIEQDVDPKVQSEIDASDVSKGIKTLDEVRASRGLDPYPDGIGEKPLIYTGTGAVLLEEAIKPPEPVPAALAPFAGPEGGPGGGQNPPGNKVLPPPGPGKKEPGQGEGGKEAAPSPSPEKVEKRRKQSPVNPIDRERPLIKAQTKEIKNTLEAGFAKAAKDVAGQVIEEKVRFEDTPLMPAEEAQRIVAALDVSAIDKVVAGIQDNLEVVAQDGAAMALIQINYDAQDITNLLDEKALEYARTRGAELVGKKWIDGELVDNPDPEWSIAENTREMLRGDIADAIEEGWSNDKLAGVIEENYGFSAERAETIARTETAFADSAGNMTAYQESGLVSGKEWILGSEHDLDDDCNENAEAGVIPLDEDFPSGDQAAPAHPNCLLPDSMVSAGGITASYKRWFEGEIVILRLSGMDELSITPNHPVLTRQGWVKAGKLQKGDELIYCTFPGEALALIYPNDHQMPAMIQEIPGALLMAGGMTALSVPSSPEDFHGDGAINGEVEIVWANSFLKNNLEAHALQNFKDKALRSGEFAGGILDPDSTAALLRKSKSAAAASNISRSDLGLPCPWAFSGHFKGMGNALSSNGQLQVVKTVAESAAMAPDSPGNIARRLSGHISLVKLQNVSVCEYHGFVYNLQTLDNYYIAQNLIVHNCVCDILPVLADQKNQED